MKKYIFGYGSLVNNESRFLTIKRQTEPIKVIIDRSFGYIRKWNYYNKDKNIIALGLEKHNIGSKINGILFDIYDNEISLLDKREIGYKKIIIPSNFINILSNDKLKNLDNSIIYTYIPTKDFLLDNYKNINKNKLNQIYLNKCCNGFLSYNYTFYESFIDTTYNWNVFLKYI
jgi:hypothetical protein